MFSQVEEIQEIEKRKKGSRRIQQRYIQRQEKETDFTQKESEKEEVKEVNNAINQVINSLLAQNRATYASYHACP